ncbi:MAG: VanZ family protein [Phycisphaerales bacterium]|nr:MAG: VanZ family protein [Phycisphaerales bacterium]
MPTSPDHHGGNHVPRAFWSHPLTLLWLGAWVGLFIITHIPVPAGTPIPRGGDKVLHFVAYFVLTMLGGRAALGRGRSITVAWAVVWAVIYAAYGAADELIQPLVGRTLAMGDWLADVGGVVAAMAILLTYHRPGGDSTARV